MLEITTNCCVVISHSFDDVKQSELQVSQVIIRGQKLNGTVKIAFSSISGPNTHFYTPVISRDQKAITKWQISVRLC